MQEQHGLDIRKLLVTPVSKLAGLLPATWDLQAATTLRLTQSSEGPWPALLLIELPRLFHSNKCCVLENFVLNLLEAFLFINHLDHVHKTTPDTV